MRYRAAAVVLALAAAVAIGQVPMYSDYPWGLLQNGTDQGPVWNLDCQSPLWCTVPTYGNGRIQLGDGGVLPVRVSFADDAGQALLAGFATYAADAGLSNRAIAADFAADAGYSLQAGLAVYALDAGLAGRSFTADFADDAGFAIFAGDAGRAYLSNFSDYASDAGYSQSSGLAGVATYALDAGLSAKAIAADFARDAGSAANADFARDAGSAASADLSIYALDAGNVQCTGCIDTARLGALAVTTAKIAGGAVTATELGAGAVTSAKLAAGAVDTTALGAGAVTSAKLGAGAVDSTALGTGAVTTAKLATGAVTTNELGALAVTTAKIASGAVTTNEIGTGAVTNAKLGVLSVATGNIQAGAVTTTELGTNAVTTAKIADLAVTAAELDDGVALSAYDEATVAGVSARTTATNCTKGAWDGATGYIRYTIGTATTNPQVSSTLYTGTSTNLLTTKAVVRYRISAGAVGKVTAMTAINNAATAQTATAVFLADGNWHTATFDISGWTTAGTLRVDLTLSSNLSTTGTWDISYMGTGTPGSGTGALVSYQGAVGIGVPTPGEALEVVKSASSGWMAQLTNSNTASNTTKTVGLELRGTDTTGTEKQAATIRATPEDSNYVASGLSFSTRTGDAVAERVAISGAGVVTVNKPTSGNNLNAVGTDGVVVAIQSSSGASSAFPQLQILNYNASGGYPLLAHYSSRGTSASPSGSSSGDVLGAWIGYGRVSAAFAEGARIEMKTTAAPGLSALTTALDLYTSNNAASSAKARLSAAGRLYIGGAVDAEELLEVRSGSSAYGLLHSNGTIKVGTYISTEGQVGTKSNHDLALFTNNGAARLRVTATGEVRLPDYAGGGTTGASIDNNGRIIRTVSDERLKENILDLPRGLDAVLRMRPVRFQWRDKQAYGDRWDIGFIAQEMISSVPEAVSKTPEGMYSLDYGKLLAVVVGAIQELFDDRTALAQRMQALEDRAEQAEARLAQLEARVAALEAWSGVAGCPPDCEPAGARPGSGQRP